MGDIHVFNLRSGSDFWAKYAERQREATELANFGKNQEVALRIQQIDSEIDQHRAALQRLIHEKDALQYPSKVNRGSRDGDE